MRAVARSFRGRSRRPEPHGSRLPTAEEVIFEDVEGFAQETRSGSSEVARHGAVGCLAAREGRGRRVGTRETRLQRN